MRGTRRDGGVIKIQHLLRKEEEMRGRQWMREMKTSSVSQFLHPYLLPSPAHSVLSLLILPHPLISSPPLSSFLFSSSAPALLHLFSSTTYLICIHLLPDRMCHRTTNYLICLLPVFLPLLRLFFSSLHYLLHLTSSLHAAFPSPALFPSPPYILPAGVSVSLFLLPPPSLSLILPSLVPSALWLRVFAWFCDL